METKNCDYQTIQKVSVIVLSYNNFSLLERCIKSIAQQSYSNCEIIFSDDGSKNLNIAQVQDNINSIVKDRMEVKYNFNSENKGTVKSFNIAIDLSSGELIVPLAIDDYFADENSIEHIVNYFNANRVLLGTSYVCEKKDNKISIRPNKNELHTLRDSKSAINAMIRHGLFFRGACTYYHRDVFKLYGKFDETYRLYEDIPFLYKYLKENNTVAIVPYICTIYSKEGISSKKIPPLALRDDRIRFYKRIADENVRNKRWIDYAIYRNVNPNGKIKKILYYSDIIIAKMIYSLFFKRKELVVTSENDMKKRISEING